MLNFRRADVTTKSEATSNQAAQIDYPRIQIPTASPLIEMNPAITTGRSPP
jgi:hypothetical protein